MLKALVLSLALLLSQHVFAATGLLSGDTGGTENFVALPKGSGYLVTNGSAGGGTYRLQIRMQDGETGKNLPNAEWTSETVETIVCEAACYVRITLEDSTAASLEWELIPKAS